MKRIILIFLMTFVNMLPDKSSYGQSFLLEPIERNVRIDIIEKFKDLHVIYGSCLEDSTLIVIVSKIEKKRIRNTERIAAGKTYRLSLRKHYEVDLLLNHMVSFSIEYEGKKYLIQSKGRASNIYYSPDLRGLNIDTKLIE